MNENNEGRVALADAIYAAGYLMLVSIIGVQAGEIGASLGIGLIYMLVLSIMMGYVAGKGLIKTMIRYD